MAKTLAKLLASEAPVEQRAAVGREPEAEGVLVTIEAPDN